MLKHCIRFLHKGYKTCISPFLGNRCRFEPYCSDYALEAIETWGLLKGTVLTIGRVLRCNPFCKGGCDPVPQKK